ncbi:MAG: VanZ family protein [Coriobacteriales bacterium]|nr:VanZ family protein [Coriobacteriales bacterium]
MGGFTEGRFNRWEQKIVKPGKRKQHALTIVLFAVYLLLLVGVILFKLPFNFELSDGVRVINLIPFQGASGANGSIVLREIIENILLFIPLGIYICMLKSEWSFAKKVLPIVGSSLAFEVIQFIFALGRSDITDILDNTLGGLIGVALYALLFKIFKSRTVKIVDILALVLTVCILLYFAYLFYHSHFGMRQLST